MIILTPGTTASEVSTTVPEIVPMSTWATTGIAASARINTPIHHRFEVTTYLISILLRDACTYGPLILLLTPMCNGFMYLSGKHWNSGSDKHPIRRAG